MLHNLLLFGPELVLIGFLVVLFLSDAFIPHARTGFFPLVVTIAACIVAGAFTYQLKGNPSAYFFGMVANDGLALFFRFVFLFACAASLYLAFGSVEIAPKHRMEFSLLLVCTTIGLSLMANALNLLMLYMGIETVSILSFVLAGFARENAKSNEASFKYLVFGAFASGVMLYGLSLIYGFTGSLSYFEIAKFLRENRASETAVFLQIAFFLIYAGLAYKIAAFPMHFWAPDVYEGSPTPVATFFSVGPKAAGFAALMRLMLEVFGTDTGTGRWSLIGEAWVIPGLALLSAITMFVGNLSAIGQKNVKRMLAYSSIAHVGYMLMGLVTLSEAGMSAILFYIFIYCAMNLGAFWVVSVVSNLRGSEDVEAFRGLGPAMPVLGVCMTVFLFSLTGIPVFSGFVGKFLLFGAIVQETQFLWLAVLGVINSVISLYYYARIIKAMWLDPLDSGAPVGSLSVYHGFALVSLAIPTVVLGLFFTPILKLTGYSLSTLLRQ